MIETLTEGQVIHALRQDEYANWSYNGACALTEYLFELEESIGEQIELDPIAWRCEFTEYESLEEWAIAYFGEDEDEHPCNIAEYIRDNSTLIEFEGGIIVQDF
jgi:hypothetical protein